MNNVRIVAVVIAAFAAVLTGAATYGQLRLQAVVNRDKDAKAAELRRRSEERIATAQETAGLANERAAQLEKEAAEAKLELARIQGRMAPRRLSSNQERILADAMRGDLMKMTIRVVSGDPEADGYAQQLSAAINQSRSVEGDIVATIFSGQTPTGLMVSKTESAANRRLVEALEKAGLPFTYSGNVAEVALVVGAKPH